MPHVPLLKLRPELREPDEVHDDTDPEDPVDNVESNTESIEDANVGGMDTNTTFHDLEEHRDVEVGVIDRVKRFMVRKQVNGRNNAVVLATAEDNSTRYGDDESSESDNEGDTQEGIPLVRRNKHKWLAGPVSHFNNLEAYLLQNLC